MAGYFTQGRGLAPEPRDPPDVHVSTLAYIPALHDSRECGAIGLTSGTSKGTAEGMGPPPRRVKVCSDAIPGLAKP